MYRSGIWPVSGQHWPVSGQQQLGMRRVTTEKPVAWLLRIPALNALAQRIPKGELHVSSLSHRVCVCLWLLGCGANIQEPGDLAGETSALTRRPRTLASNS